MLRPRFSAYFPQWYEWRRLGVIDPISNEQRVQVVAATHACMKQAGEICKRHIPRIPVLFDLNGRAAGMYRVRGRERAIRFNPYLFAKDFEDGLRATVPHEVAHYVTDLLFGLGNIKPHGAEWQEVMLALGAVPEVTGRYDLRGVPVRRQRRFRYRCDCAVHLITTRRHNMILRGQASYACRRCGSSLQAAPES